MVLHSHQSMTCIKVTECWRATLNLAMKSIVERAAHSTNLIGVPAQVIASTTYNQHPVPLSIAGVRETANSLFTTLDSVNDPIESGTLFQHYMTSVFGEELSDKIQPDHKPRRYKNSYLRLIQDWGLDSNSAQSAVFKGWVESRFGLLPTYHKQAITAFYDRTWLHYLSQKMHSRYHNNCIYMQLDLLFEFCQWFIQRHKQPAETFITLFRGVNAIDKQCIESLPHKNHKIIRFNNITSFTNRPSTASEFGDNILKVVVPVFKIVFFNQLLPHHALHGESEFLVIGGDYHVELI